jgi:CheY-like chemotaxis protein
MNEKIAFVVDDEAVFAKALSSFLNSHGYSAIPFANSLEALDASVHLSPDLLLSDFNMSEMDGLTLAQNLTERHPDCKVLMMTGAIEESATHPAFSRFEILPKPVPPSVLLAKVVEVLGGGAAENGGKDSGPL